MNAPGLGFCEGAELIVVANSLGTSRADSLAMNQSSYSGGAAPSLRGPAEQPEPKPHSRGYGRGLALALGCVACSFAPLARAEAGTSDEVVDTDADEGLGDPTASGVLGSPQLTGQFFWAQGKVMPGLAIGVGQRWVEMNLELSMLSLTRAAPPQNVTFLGNQFGVQVMFVPVREEHVDLGIGLGGDFYWLWGVHSDAVESALTLKAATHVWLTPQLGLYASARVYPLTSSGLELGTDRDSESALPVLVSTGITWRL